MTARASPVAIAAVAPGLVSALAFACVGVFGKASILAGADVLTFLAFRGLVGIAVMAVWLRTMPRAPFTPREKTVALGLGLLFAGNIYTLFKAFEIIPVPLAELIYFIYPLLTGVIGAALRVDRLGSCGVAAAVIAFAGLALMVGAHTGGVVVLGVAFAVASAVFRTAMLLIARAALPDSDPRITSWYTLIASTAVLGAVCLATEVPQFPDGPWGWSAFIGASIAAAIAVLALFTSTGRIGPFRTALVMNLEPASSIVLAYLVLGEAINAAQLAGAAVMIAALVWFQLRR